MFELRYLKDNNLFTSRLLFLFRTLRPTYVLLLSLSRLLQAVLRDLRAADLIMGLPWLDDEHASLQFGSTRVFTLMDGTTVETTLEERRPECLLMSSAKVQKPMRKTRRSRGRNAEFYVIELTPAANQPTEFHTRGAKNITT
jgi:hypothetical protein